MAASTADKQLDMTLQLARVARIRRRTTDHLLTPYGLSEATAYPLLVLLRSGRGMGQSELAEAIGIEGPSLVRLIDLLERDGLVERREHPTDRRAKVLFLTKAGKGKAATIDRVLVEGRAAVYRDISSEDLAIANKVLSEVEESAIRLLSIPVAKARRAKSTSN